MDLVSDDDDENEYKSLETTAQLKTKTNEKTSVSVGPRSSAKKKRLVASSSSSDEEETTLQKPTRRKSDEIDDVDDSLSSSGESSSAEIPAIAVTNKKKLMPASKGKIENLKTGADKRQLADAYDDTLSTDEGEGSVDEQLTVDGGEVDEEDEDLIEKENDVATQSYNFDEILDDVDFDDNAFSGSGRVNEAPFAMATPALPSTLDLSNEDEEVDDETRRILVERERVMNELKLLDVDERNLEDELMRVQTMIANVQSRRDTLKRELAALRMDGSKDKTWSSESFPHSKVLRGELNRIFGFSKFRELQLEVMNATICGRDCFVVLPTGSGKSLLFQLPAVVQGGITVVISPLLSLSRDQLLNLADKGISGLMISSEQDREELKRSYTRLFNGDPSLKLVYVTPEMLVQSKKFVSVLEALHRKRLLTRIVVDEAHCCSTMGHDFRPDYQKLFFLKRQFPSVPLLCVTATATVQVEEDVKRVLLGGKDDWLVFRASFNRANLRYEVVEKKGDGSSFNAQLCGLVNTRFAKQCGIVYCLSRKDAENAAEVLRKAGCSARPYHARLPTNRNRDTHEQWRTGRVRVVCATTAFGMGIDKPDVRFVVHSTLSTSIEGYAQESGRAGRDGKEATCVLLYRRQDVSRVSQLISDKQTGEQKLFEMIRYCENCSDCRRVVMGRCFGESFDPNKCQKTCDVCAAESPAIKLDHTLHAENVLRKYLAVRSIGRSSYLTQTQLVDAWRGTGSASSSSSSSGAGSHFKCPDGWSRSDCERLVLQMLLRGVLKIHWTYNAHRTTAYMDVGERAHQLLRQFEPSQVKVEYFVPGAASASSSSTRKKKANTTEDEEKGKAQKGKASTTTATAGKRKPSAAASKTVAPSKTTLTDMFQRVKERTVGAPIQIDLDMEEDEFAAGVKGKQNPVVTGENDSDDDLWSDNRLGSRKGMKETSSSLIGTNTVPSTGFTTARSLRESVPPPSTSTAALRLSAPAPLPTSWSSFASHSSTLTRAPSHQSGVRIINNDAASASSLLTAAAPTSSNISGSSVLTAPARLPASYIGSSATSSLGRIGPATVATRQNGSFYGDPEEEDQFDPDAYYG